MNMKNVLCGGVAGTIFVFLFDWVVHGMMLAGMYEATASLWRSQVEMESMMWFMILTQALLAFAMAYFVVRKGRRGCQSGARFGAMIGVFLAIGAITNYMFLPFTSFALPAIWAVAIFVTSVCVGAVAGQCNKNG